MNEGKKESGGDAGAFGSGKKWELLLQARLGKDQVKAGWGVTGIGKYPEEASGSGKEGRKGKDFSWKVFSSGKP